MSDPIVLGGLVIGVSGVVLVCSVIELMRLRLDEREGGRPRRKTLRRQPRRLTDAIADWIEQLLRSPLSLVSAFQQHRSRASRHARG